MSLIWHVRCADCLAAAVYSDRGDADDWAEDHRCPPQTTGNQPGNPNTNPTR